MILRRLNNRLIVTSQMDHAWASGELVRALSEEYVDEDSVEMLAMLTAHHDDGWEEWEEQAIRPSETLPKSFMEIDTEAHHAIWRRGVQLAVDRWGAFAGATLACHAAELGSDAETGKDNEFAARSAELLRQALPGEDPTVRRWRLERAFRVLRFCDLLTLAPCAGWTDPLSECLVGEDGRRVDIHLEEKTPFRLHLEPWPFTFNRVEVAVPVFRLGNESEWKARARDFLAGQREMQPLVIVPTD